MSNQQKKIFTSNDIEKNMYKHKHLIIPEGYTAIDDFRLKSYKGQFRPMPWSRISLPASMTDIVDTMSLNYYAEGYTNLKYIIVDEANPAYCDLNGVLFSKDRTTLLCYPSGKTQSEYIIPDSVTTIASCAFFNCMALKYVTLPARLTYIGESAFRGCLELTRMDIPAGVNFIGTNALYGCLSLTQITVDDGNPMYSSLDGVLYNKNKTAVIKYPTSKTQSLCVILSGVTNIQNNAFQDCPFTKVIMPDSMKYIGDRAFMDCWNLEDVTLPDGLVIIGNGAFSRCALTSVNIPDSVLFIGWGAFSECLNLLNIIIPSEITDIPGRHYEIYNPNLLITCAEGSFAHEYAVEVGLKFEFIQNN